MKRLHTTVRRNELRLVRKYGYEYELSDKDADFEMFFHKMYLPSMRTRHGRQARLVPYEKAYHSFQQGTLFLVKREGVCVSSGVCNLKREPGVVHFLLEGVLNADQQLLKEGAQSALYYAIIHWSNKQGYQAVDFEASVPFLKKGILQYKRKWGVAARVNSDRRIWLKIHRNTPAVRQFMEDNPCLIINRQRGLQGLFFTDEPDNVSAEAKVAWGKLCEMPGLNGYLIRSVEDFLDQSI